MREAAPPAPVRTQMRRARTRLALLEATDGDDGHQEEDAEADADGDADANAVVGLFRHKQGHAVDIQRARNVADARGGQGAVYLGPNRRAAAGEDGELRGRAGDGDGDLRARSRTRG